MAVAEAKLQTQVDELTRRVARKTKLADKLAVKILVITMCAELEHGTNDLALAPLDDLATLDDKDRKTLVTIRKRVEENSDFMTARPTKAIEYLLRDSAHGNI